MQPLFSKNATYLEILLSTETNTFKKMKGNYFFIESWRILLLFHLTLQEEISN